MRLFRKRLGQNEKLIRNIERYEQEEKAKQQESKVLGQKLVKGKSNKKEKIKQQESKILGQKPVKGTTNKGEKANV